MALVLLWLPFVLIGMCVGVGMQYPTMQERVAAAGLRPDRFKVFGLVVGLLGPLSLVWYVISQTDRRVQAWLRIESPMPPHLQALGVATPEDVDRLSKEVRAGERPCFVPDHDCGICRLPMQHWKPNPLAVFLRDLPTERQHAFVELLTADEQKRLAEIYTRIQNGDDDPPPCPDPGAHDVCAGLKRTLDAMSQGERDAMVLAMQRAAERNGTEDELAAALRRGKP